MANTLTTFCTIYGNQHVYAEGSTPSRTRLYQTGIASLWDEIRMNFEVYGLKDTNWHAFKPYGLNYEAFWLKESD